MSVGALAEELVQRGHECVYLRSGMDYSLRPGMRIRRSEVWKGVGCYSLFNSPNLAPGNFNFRNVGTQVRCAAQAARVVAWVKAAAPDVVHIHALEGFSFDTVAAIRAAGFAVVITPHNYYYLCPQVDLLHDEKRVCTDYEGGVRCVGCLSHAPDPVRYRGWRKRYQTAERVFGPHALADLKSRMGHMRRWAGSLVGGRTGPVADEVEEGSRGEMPTPLPAAERDVEARLLAANGHLVVLNEYGERRRAAVEALNSANTVLCPSRFLSRVYGAFGVAADRLRVVPLGQPHFDEMNERARDGAFYERSPWNAGGGGWERPLRFAFFGNCFPNKGLATLCTAIQRLAPDVSARSHFVIRASGDDAAFRAAMRGFANVSFLGKYDLGQLVTTPGEYDVCVFPNMGLENSPLVVLEALNAGKFIIASDLGGPTDWVEPGRNGLLFRAGDCDALAGCIGRVVRGEVRLPSPKEIHAASRLRRFEEYVAEVEGCYEGVSVKK